MNDQQTSKATSEENDKLFETINRNANRINGLLEDFINVTRIENNLLTLIPENTSICSLVKDAVKEFNDISNINNREESKIKRKINFEEPNFEIDPVVNIDRTKIYQVISNLLNNALKFSPSNKEITVNIELGEETGFAVNNVIPATFAYRTSKIYNNKSSSSNDKDTDYISLSSQRNTNKSNENIVHNGNENGKPKIIRKRVIIKIKDKGKGIDEQLYPKLFEKFSTIDNNSGIGLGLGLYISKYIIEIHRGKIWAENNKEEPGATFSISLPLLE
jgi:signal transduction histidine kinase